MPISDQYELLDFGAGRKLERFGPWIVDRPSPAAADHVQRQPEIWSEAVARYVRGDAQRGTWSHAGPKTWAAAQEMIAATNQ